MPQPQSEEFLRAFRVFQARMGAATNAVTAVRTKTTEGGLKVDRANHLGCTRGEIDGHRGALRAAAAKVGLVAGAAADLARVLTEAANILVDNGSKKLRATPPLTAGAPVDGKTSLYIAARNGDEGAVRALVAAGAEGLNTANANGWTPLHVAARWGRDAVVKALLAAGVPAAVAAGVPAWVAALGVLSAVPALEMVDTNGETALHVAARNGSEAVVRALLVPG